MPGAPADSRWLLAADLVSAWSLVWVARFGGGGDLTRDAHSFFANRYHRLSSLYRARGQVAKADRFETKALEHDRASGNDGPPYAAAMALPRPKRLVITNAVSGAWPEGPDDAA